MEVQEAEAKTPMKNHIQSEFATPSTKTPKSHRRRGLFPTPGGSCDRFIPNRSAMEVDLSHHLVLEAQRASEESGEREKISPSQAEYQRVMSETLNGRDISKARILRFGPRKPMTPTYTEVMQAMSSGSANRVSTLRVIPKSAERCLDAPEIVNDYYLNTLDWSSKNVMAVGLQDAVYLWDASTHETTLLMELKEEKNIICSLSYNPQGTYLAVGTTFGNVELWDVETKKRVRNMPGHTKRVNALTWNSTMLSSGSKSGKIHHHDVRQSQHLAAEIKAHRGEVCGLRWSPNGHFLASGGNDDLLKIWSAPMASSDQPLLTFKKHKSAVKALAWSPWNHNRLASGGGFSDQCIRLWNCCNGEQYSYVNTGSQVASILWSTEYHEIISGHHLPDYALSIWKEPTLTKITDLKGHIDRILHMALSPDGTTVVSASADESLRFWKCFNVSKARKQAQKKLFPTSVLLRPSIR